MVGVDEDGEYSDLAAGRRVAGELFLHSAENSEGIERAVRFSVGGDDGEESFLFWVAAFLLHSREKGLSRKELVGGGKAGDH